MPNKTGFFDVPKGNDVFIVYNDTKSLLNLTLWCPSFYLPDIDSIFQNEDLYTWFGGIDLGEMFLNYMLDEEFMTCAGVDV